MPHLRMTAIEAAETIKSLYCWKPELWSVAKVGIDLQTSHRPGAPWSSKKDLVHVELESRLTPPAPFSPKPGWKLYRVTGSFEPSALDMMRTCYQTPFAMRRGAWNFETNSPDYWNTDFDPFFLVKLISSNVSSEIINSSPSPPSTGEFVFTPSILSVPTCTVYGRPCDNYIINLVVRNSRWQSPIIELFSRRRPRKFGRTALPRWLKEHDAIKLGRKFTRQRDKLVEHPNSDGFGNSGTGTWRSRIRDSAKRIAVDAAKEAVSSATKSIKSAAAKQAGLIIKKRANDALRRITRKR